MEEGRRHHPPRLKRAVLRGGKDVVVRELFVYPVPGNQHLQCVNHNAGCNEAVRHQRFASGNGTAVDAPYFRRRPSCFVDAVNALESDGGRPLAVRAGGAPAALAAHIGRPVRVPGAYRNLGGRLSRRNSVTHGGALQLFDVDAVDGDVLDRAVTHAGADTLDGVYDLLGFLVSHFTEDGVLALEPVRGNGGDEEL